MSACTVGVYGINQGGLGLVSANYDLSYQGNNLTITKALLNVIADGRWIWYRPLRNATEEQIVEAVPAPGRAPLGMARPAGDADPSLTYQVSGLKNGDTAGSILTGGLNRAAGENVGMPIRA